MAKGDQLSSADNASSSSLWTLVGVVAGAVLGYTAGNSQGAVMGSAAGAALGSQRDKTGSQVTTAQKVALAAMAVNGAVHMIKHYSQKDESAVSKQSA
ncbi:hypothetical protein THASP1DRAFT_31366 [Thamnocephalis sphaerospora]|uniref:Glycine zipper 2TM domain-containing protein n=1 Tax=Thamnocephalis sphaerospora TaxID=78915 RepID=A0A4P9XLR4_9FUNG|nr:hypothetical protein THASP1DRAFT_31366 [Thamnocephalis sphaerospora]|eukprot:RKP06827.1 hypothetical protein THASP1DRAFT_31366 [Thamnocephalis sphaerospora]